MRIQSDDLNWFVGVVEDRDDPQQQGRVRVRVVGVHPFSRIQGDVSGIPVEDLPWMSVCLPVTSATNSGVTGAITGLLNGSSVFGIWLDKYKTNGIILGTYAGNQKNKPNSEEGFSDPSGKYPNSSGNDSSGLNSGGALGDSSGANTTQNGNGVTAVLTGKDVAGEDNNPSLSIEKMLEADESVKNVVYWIDGYPHIGVGHLIVYRRTKDMSYINSLLTKQVGRSVNNSITSAEVSKLFKQDLDKVRSEIRKNSTISPVYSKVNRSRQMALENMAYQMGTGGLAKFKSTLSLLSSGKYAEAASSAKNSVWAKQTPGRANRVCLILKNGNLASYGVMPPKKVGKMMLKSVSSDFMSFLDNFNPFDSSDKEIYPDYSNFIVPDGFPEDLSESYIEEETGVLFTEPTSSYRGEYPYVKATKTESGHIQEFDDTPGHERFRQIHPSGSYVEDAPDGRKTDKCVGDRYFLTSGSRNEATEGDYKVNVGGTETYINFSDVNRTIEGNDNTKISGNKDLTVEGNEVVNITGDGTINVSGNVKIIVQGNAEINVSGNASSKVSGNYDLNVDGTCNFNSKGNMKLSAPRIDLG